LFFCVVVNFNQSFVALNISTTQFKSSQITFPITSKISSQRHTDSSSMDAATSDESANAARATARLQQELLQMLNNPPDGISAFPSEDNLLLWNAVIQGPEGSPYENLEFRLSLQYSSQYPFQPPKVLFLSGCYHPNVMLRVPGDICLDILQNAWSAVMSTTSILVSIQSLLAEPNPASPLNVEAAELWVKDQRRYTEKVLQFHEQHP
jgi:ubiquitin-conjugating enzyme E2 C